MSFLQELVTRLTFSADTRGLESVHEKLEGITRATRAIAAVEIGKFLIETAEKFTSFGETLEASAVAAGITTEALQRLQYAASQNAVGSEELSGALARMGRSLYAAQQGSKQAVANFARIGISQQQLASFTNAEDAFYAVQDAINSNAATATQKIGLLQAFFGRGSARMAKFIAVGSAGTKKLGQEAAEMGAIVSNSGIKNLAELEDKVSGAKLVFRAFLANLGATFAPVFIRAIESIEKSWMQNQDAIKAGIKTFSWYAVFAFSAIFEAVRLAFGIVTRFAREHSVLTEWGLKAFLAFSVAASGLEIVLSSLDKFRKFGFVVTLAKRLYVAFAALAANPLFIEIGAIVASIALMVFWLNLLYTWLFKGGSFKDSWLGQLLSGEWDISGKIKKTLGAASGAAISVVGNLVGAAVPALGAASAGAANVSGTVQGMQVAAPANNDVPMPALIAPPAKAQQLVGGGSMAVTAPITITVPAGTSQQQAIDIASRGAKKGLLDAINEANRGFANAQAY